MKKYQQNHDKGVFIAMFLSMMIIMLWQELYVRPMLEVEKVEDAKTIGDNEQVALVHQDENITTENVDRHKLIKAGVDSKSRIPIENDYIHGSLNLIGVRIDDVVLKKHMATLGVPEDGKVVLLSPANSKNQHFYELGWVSNDKSLEVPNKETLWNCENITANKIMLGWTNQKGVHFGIKLEISEDYMIKVTQTVLNGLDHEVVVRPYIAVSKVVYDNEQSSSNMAVHEGFIGVFNGVLNEIKLKDVGKGGTMFDTNSGWLGFSEKYWMTSILSQVPFTGRFIETNNGKDYKRYQVDALFVENNIAPGAFVENSAMLFLGAKNIEIIDKYQKMYNLPLFDRAIDFGVLYFITKPILLLLHKIYEYLGNFGFSIMILTIIVKLLLLPLAYKSFSGMNRMKDLQPKLAKLKEMYKDDNKMLQRAMIELYKKEGVNPMAGCLPIIMQMPVFFALYKVLYVSIEMRHAGFIWWIKDLSVRDPSTIFNLFGLIPWQPPELLMIGLLPILMSLSMYIQQNMNPPPIDPTQANVMKMIPVVLLFTFSSFPSGLVLYWAWSNVLSIAQQYLIKTMSTGRKR